MIISIKNEEGEVTNFDVSAIADEQKKADATVMVNKVGNLSVVIEALDFASRTHRANYFFEVKDGKHIKI
jgi:translation initiation factor IF-3